MLMCYSKSIDLNKSTLKMSVNKCLNRVTSDMKNHSHKNIYKIDVGEIKHVF